MWPRFKLTPEESVFNSKYENPATKQVPVLRRFYYGQINITPTIRQDQETFQISRRSRAFALTASGDINLVEIQIADITGEQFTTDFIPLSNLLGGSNWDSRGVEFYNPAIVPAAVNGINTGFVFIMPASYAPHIFEPNIVLAPNQTLTFTGRTIDPERLGPIHVSLCLHVVEFPGMPGSPM